MIQALPFGISGLSPQEGEDVVGFGGSGAYFVALEV